MLPLQGKSILIIEDEYLVALDIASVLKDAGASAIIAPTAKDAFPLVVWGRFHAAILDQNSSDESNVRARLKQMGVPVVIYSGSITKLDVDADVPRLSKLSADRVIVNAVGKALGGPLSASGISRAELPSRTI